MEEKRTETIQQQNKKLKLRERTLAYVVEHQEHGFILPIILVVVLVAAILFLGASERKNTLSYSTDKKAHSQAEDEYARITFVGDIVLGRNVAVRANDVGYDKLLSKMQEIWEKSDVVMANLDTCIIDCDVSQYNEVAKKKSYFYTDKSVLSMLKDGGIDIVSLATDHIADYGRPTIKTAIDRLDELGIEHVGAGEDRETASAYILKEITTTSGNTIKVAIFGAQGHLTDEYGAKAKRQAADDVLSSDLEWSDYSGFDYDYDTTQSDAALSDTAEDYDPWEVTAGTYSGRTQTFVEDIANTRAVADVIVVYMHWGDDKMFTESDDMRELAHRYIDAGADIIIGSNPRVLLPIETYKRVKTGFIFYSIGSFLYDDAESRVCDSVSVDLIIDENMQKTLEITPLRINACVPSRTESVFYTKRIFASLTKNLDDELYRVENNKLIIPIK